MSKDKEQQKLGFGCLGKNCNCNVFLQDSGPNPCSKTALTSLNHTVWWFHHIVNLRVLAWQDPPINRFSKNGLPPGRF